MFKLLVWAKATRESIKWPAVRFIISRSERVNGRKKHLISSTQDIKIAKANAGRLAGVKWEGHHDFVIRELKNGVDQRGKAKEIVNINCVGIVKLKGSNPLMFQAKIAKHVNKKGVVNFLRGLRAEHNLFIVKLITVVLGFLVENCFIKKGTIKGKVNKIQLIWWKFDVPGSKIFSICVIIISIYLFLKKVLVLRMVWL